MFEIFSFQLLRQVKSESKVSVCTQLIDTVVFPYVTWTQVSSTIGIGHSCIGLRQGN